MENTNGSLQDWIKEVSDWNRERHTAWLSDIIIAYAREKVNIVCPKISNNAFLTLLLECLKPLVVDLEDFLKEKNK